MCKTNNKTSDKTETAQAFFKAQRVENQGLGLPINSSWGSNQGKISFLNFLKWLFQVLVEARGIISLYSGMQDL